jgi:hypothetical protein
VNSRTLTLALDSVDWQPHTSAMAAPTSVVEVTDPRDDHRRLRLSWHPERSELIVSHWRDNVCIATTPVGVKELAGLIGLLVQALQDAATRPPSLARPGYEQSRSRFWARCVTWGRRYLDGTVFAVARRRSRLRAANVRRAA